MKTRPGSHHPPSRRQLPAGGLGTAACLACAALLSAALPAQDRQLGQNRSIERVSEHVYRFGSDNQYGAYILTSAGIIVIDGHYCGSGTMEWLKTELASRHEVPVRYVVLSHDHQDHICASGVFSDTAVAVAHRNLRPHVIREQRDAAPPDLGFDTEMEIHLGGLSVRLLYFGPSHSDNLISIHIPEDRVLVSIDIARDSLFPDLRDMDVHGMLDNLDRLSRLESVDIVLPGHGQGLLAQDNFSRMRLFLATLESRVHDAMIQGLTLPEIRAAVSMDEFNDLGGLERSLDTNIVTMYDYLYRYREPNQRIEPFEAVACIESSAGCRTSDR